MTNKLIKWKIFALWLAAAALVSWGLRASAGLADHWGIGIVMAALLLSSIIAEIEERITNKPTAKKDKPRR